MTELPDGVHFTVTVNAEEMADWSPARVKMLFKGMTLIQRALGHRLGASPPPPVVSPEVVDEIHRFLTARCIVDEASVVSARDLYAAYEDWATPLTLEQRRFGMVLTKLGFARVRAGHERRWHWLGIGIQTP